MDREGVGLDTLTRPERAALRELLIRATAAAGRPSDRSELMAGTASAFLLALRGETVLHASAVAVDG